MASKIKVDQLETADGTGTIALQNQLSGMTSVSMPSGALIQTVNRTFGTQSTTTSTGYTDTDCYVDITPTSTSSKILIQGSVSGYSASTGVSAYFKIFRGSTELTVLQRFEDVFLFNVAPTELDSPSSTSSIRYMLKMKSQNGNSVGVNMSATGILVAMEIAG